MSGSEEETYSTMFSSLKHPARRKILRMLSRKSMTYSEMLDELSIPSSHLTYHLENLGELVVKADDGKYKLSSFGDASVSMMRSAEEVPDIHARRFSALPLRWKWVFALLTIGMVLLASMSFVQYSYFSRLSADYASLMQDFEEVKAENAQLLSWSSSAKEAMILFRDVIQIDLSKYQATLLSSTAVNRLDLGGVIEEVSEYSLVNSASRIDITLRFRNGHFSLLYLNQLEGLPNFPLLYTEPQPADALQAASELIERYKSFTRDSYLDEMSKLLASANASSSEQVMGNTKLKISDYDDSSEILLQYTVNGADFAAKSLHIVFQDNAMTEFSDDWLLYKVGSDQVNVSRDMAIQIARNAAKDYRWTSNGVEVTNFTVLDYPVSAEFYPHGRTEPLTLFPYWYVTLYLDKTYPGGVAVIAVGVWADTGQVASIQALGGQQS